MGSECPPSLSSLQVITLCGYQFLDIRLPYGSTSRGSATPTAEQEPGLPYCVRYRTRTVYSYTAYRSYSFLRTAVVRGVRGVWSCVSDPIRYGYRMYSEGYPPRCGDVYRLHSRVLAITAHNKTDESTLSVHGTEYTRQPSLSRHRYMGHGSRPGPRQVSSAQRFRFASPYGPAPCSPWSAGRRGRGPWPVHFR